MSCVCVSAKACCHVSGNALACAIRSPWNAFWASVVAATDWLLPALVFTSVFMMCRRQSVRNFEANVLGPGGPIVEARFVCHIEVGRAAGKERVCTYVLVMVDAVRLKKTEQVAY